MVSVSAVGKIAVWATRCCFRALATVGGLPGLFHRRCLLAAAQADPTRWTACPACGVGWHKELNLSMATERWRLVADQPEKTPSRLQAALHLAQAVAENGNLAEAVRLGAHTLAISRDTHGKQHPQTLLAAGRLAAHMTEVGDFASALPLQIEVLAAHRARDGNDSPVTQVAMRNLAISYHHAGNKAAAALLYKAVLDIRRRTLPADHPDLLASTLDVDQMVA